jgi:hypothetical protein
MTNPVFGLPHLSEDAVAAFADGVLSAAAASRAQRHCAECAECADAVRVQREAAMMLRAAQAPSLPSGLLDRLAGLPMSATLPPSRGGLPTVLGADGTAMFVAYDVHKASEASQSRSGEEPEASVQRPARPHHRGALPVAVLASAAAVVAAGAFGGQVSTLAAAADRPAPAGAANVAGSLTGGQSTALPAPSPFSGARTLLGTNRPVASPASASADQPARPALRPGSQLATSVTLAPLRRDAQRPSAAASWSRLARSSATPASSSGSAATTSAATTSAAASSARTDRPATRPAGERSRAGSVPPMAGEPVARP